MSIKLDGDEQSKIDKGDSATQRSDLSSMGQPKDYESMLQKMEAEVRNHIRVEQQLKLHIETMQGKIDECERQLKTDPNKGTSLIDVLK